MKHFFKHFSFYLVPILILANLFVWQSVLSQGNRPLSVSFFDIGQGDSEFIEAPNGNQVLIDGGPTNAILAKLGEVMPLGDRSIDLIILSHPHVDHLLGLVEVLNRYDVGAVLESGVVYGTSEYKEWNRLLEEKNIPVVIAITGEKVYLSDDVYFDIFAPRKNFVDQKLANVHDSMVVAQLHFGSSTIVFSGDMETSLERELVLTGDNLKSDILKIGHHGSKTSTSEEFLKAVNPQFAVISVGEGNTYGHPTKEILGRLTSFGIKIFRTDLDGDVFLQSDGRTWVRK
ncbi:MAG: MBL fold metallo-hydrolase [Parcubacteria group bacterium]|nr:MBL fold metallo-hydrolase [Parcubacteria group bacterium]